MIPFQWLKPVASRSGVEYCWRGCAVFSLLFNSSFSVAVVCGRHTDTVVHRAGREVGRVGWEAMSRSNQLHYIV
jgi:hypothetical protein